MGIMKCCDMRWYKDELISNNKWFTHFRTQQERSSVLSDNRDPFLTFMLALTIRVTQAISVVQVE